MLSQFPLECLPLFDKRGQRLAVQLYLCHLPRLDYANDKRRLHANSTINGVIRAAIVPVEEDNSMFLEAVELLNAHADTYPIRGEVWVSLIPLEIVNLIW